MTGPQRIATVINNMRRDEVPPFKKRSSGVETNLTVSVGGSRTGGGGDVMPSFREGDLVRWTKPGTSGALRRVLKQSGTFACCEWRDASSHYRRGWICVLDLQLVKREA